MKIACPSCRAAIPSEDVNVARVLAKCRQCHSVFDFSGQVEGKARRDRGEIALPANLRVEEFSNTLTITRSWRKGLGGFLLFFALFWDSIVSVFVVQIFLGKEGAFSLLFLAPFLAVGLGTLYAAVALLVDRTTIRVEDGRLTVRNTPVPWPGNREMLVDDLAQLYCTEYVGYTQNDVPQYRYAVWALGKDGGKIKVAGGMEDPDQALYVEGVLEKHLRIEDRPVRDEYRGG